MPELLNYKDAKNIIIYLLLGLVCAGSTLYAKDQGHIKEKQQEIAEAAKTDKLEIVDLIKETAESQKRRDDKYRYFFRDEMIKFQESQKANADQINKMAIDIAILKSKTK